MIETNKQFVEAKEALIELDLDIADRRGLLKVRTKAARKLRREIQEYGIRKQVEGKR